MRWPLVSTLMLLAGFVSANAVARLVEDAPLTKLTQLGVVPPIPGSLVWPSNVALVPRKQGEERIWFIGASETVAMPYEPQGRVSYGNLLGVGLQAGLGRPDLHVRADGGIALDSPQLADFARKLLEYGDPSAIVLVVGGNEFLNRLPLTAALRPDGAVQVALDFAASTRRIFEAAAHWIEARDFYPRAAFEAPATNVAGFDRLVREAAPERPALRGLPIGDADRELMLGRLEATVRALAADCERRGVRFLLALAPHGYGVQAPWCPVQRPAPLELPFDLRAALHDDVTAVPGLTLAALDRAIARWPERADLRHVRGRFLRATERPGPARVAFDNALDLDLAPLHRTRGVIARLDALARDLGHDLLRLGQAFEGASQDEVRRSFLDYAHPTIEGHRRIARWLAKERLAALLPTTAGTVKAAQGTAVIDERAFDEAVSTITAAVTERSRERAAGVLQRTVASYYMCFGNFREAAVALAEARRVFEAWAARGDATDEDRDDAKRARDEHERCLRALDAAREERR